MNQQDYNATMQLPQTEFPMRAGLPKSEPERLAGWEKNRLYHLIMEKNAGKPLFILHDGPPYANGDIHIGHALNKILKDMIVRYRNLSGYQAPYVPGWDTHGLPIELKAREKAGLANAAEMSPVELRAICREFALGYVDNQRGQFKRLGVLGEWERPYMTLLPEFEARQIEAFAEMADKGYIYKGLKPVYWCPECQTALAEAEIEYAEDACVSIYVKFRVTDDRGVLSAAGVDPAKTYFVIWTTTTWTLPANVAICLNGDFTYQVLKCGEEYYVMAEELATAAMEQAGKIDYEVVASFTGAQLEGMWTQHPFLDRQSMIIVGDHVTLESGTGCVHTAPGHGVEDFNVCKNYPQLPIVVPVDKEGHMTEEAGVLCAGMTTDAANKVLLAELERSGALFAHQKITHQYPHCWRCHKPVLFRATEQWFCSVDSFKDEAVKAIEGVQWIPAWGEDRITSMVRERADWCISRQRLWGVPIPAFYCEDCGKAILDKTFIHNVASIFEKEGSDAWYIHSAEELLPAGARCPHCGGQHFRKETDIMDVWFDSGTSHLSVSSGEIWKDQRWPADLYLEGADQYRGWFQSSLLTAVACRGEAPYRAVLTHGWTVDGEGRKMSKSLGNGVDPQQVIDQYGADILRLWVSSLDYKTDARLSQDILKQQAEAYRKIRNTARFILSNLFDFDPNTDMVADADLPDIDRFMRMRLDELTADVCKGYDNYAFYEVMHRLHNFCVVDLSNFYLDVIKDRLYVEAATGASRRAAQSTIYHILSVLTRLLAPILAFTAEEIWSYLPHTAQDDVRSVMLNEIPQGASIEKDDAFTEKWNALLAIRETVQKALEEARTEKRIGGSLEAKVTILCKGENLDVLKNAGIDLTTLFIVSQVVLQEGDGELSVTVEHAEGEKCARCWMYSETVGSHPEHTDLCARCAEILG